MNHKEKRINGNGVNGISARADAVSSGQQRYVRQVTAVRHQATVHTDKQLRIATWNVNILFQAGKFDNLMKKAKRLNLDILGVSETRWSGIGRCKRECYAFIYSGGEKHENGVGVLLLSEVAKCLAGYVSISDRVVVTLNTVNTISSLAYTSRHHLASFLSSHLGHSSIIIVLHLTSPTHS